MIDVAINWEENELKEVLVFTIANHMKKVLNWNKDTVDDAVILDHLDELSNGKLKVSAAQLPLSESSELLKFKSKNGNGPKSNIPTKSRNHKRKRY